MHEPQNHYTWHHISSWMTANLLTLNSSKTEFLLISLQQQLAKIHNCSLNTTDSARNLGFIFDSHLTFCDHISSLSKSWYYHIRELRCICPYLDFKTASTIATSVHSKLDYCISLYYKLQPSKISNKSPSIIQNFLARAVVKAPKFCHVTSILKSLYWLKINERIKYKPLSYLQSSYHCSTHLSAQPDLCPAPSCYSLLICCQAFSATYVFFSKNHQSLISLCITSSLESTSCLIPSALHKKPC